MSRQESRHSRVALVRVRDRRPTPILRIAASASLLALSLTPLAAVAQHSHSNLPPEVPAAEVPTLEAQRRALLDKVMENPGDVEAALAYAVASTKLGDYEAATATYERLLVQYPRTPRLQLELGALYFRLGAHALARSLFAEVEAREDTPDPVRRSIEGYMRAMDVRKATTKRFSGRAIIGIRAESNANAAPENEFVSLNGIDFLLSPESRGRSDQSAQLGGQFRYREKFNQHGDLFTANVSASAARYRELETLDNAGAELRIGADVALQRFGVRDGWLSLSAVGGQTWLESERYMYSKGATASFRRPLGRQSSLAVSLDWRNETYTPDEARASARGYSGDRYRASASYTRQLSADWQGLVGLSVDRREAASAFNSYWEPRISLGVNHRYRPLIGNGQRPWLLALQLQYAQRENDEPLLIVSREQAQSNHDALLLATQTIPLSDSLELQFNAGYRQISSNYDIRDYSNRFAGVSLVKNF